MSKAAPSRGERAAWRKLRAFRSEGFSFRREHAIGPYRVDFVCLRRRLIVEIDGGVHRMSGRAEHDARRDAWLAAEGFLVIRVSDGEACGSDDWLRRVRDALLARPDASFRWKTAPRAELDAPLPLEGGAAREGVRSQSAPSPSDAHVAGEAAGVALYALTPPPTPSPSRGGGEPFWKTKTLAEMSEAEWESLCDGCGKCCLIGLEDEDTGEIYLTDVACKLLDGETCRCTDYANRKARVPDCVKLAPDNVASLNWLPRTCAYRLVSEGRDLYWWHPLVSGDPESVHAANVSVRGKTRPEGRLKVAGLMKRITKWPEPAPAPRRARKRS